MNASANSCIGAKPKRQPPTFEFSWMPSWERNKAKPTWSQSSAATWRSVPWLPPLPTVTHFTVVDPYGAESIVSLGEKPLCFRGSIMVPGRKRPLRHLVSCSQELADTSSDGKLLLISDDHSFIWSSLVRHYGLPATPEWGAWMIAQLQQQKRIQPLLGFGYSGVAVKAKRKELLALLRRGLRSKQLGFPTQNGAVEWPEIRLIKKTA